MIPIQGKKHYSGHKHFVWTALHGAATECFDNQGEDRVFILAPTTKHPHYTSSKQKQKQATAKHKQPK